LKAIPLHLKVRRALQLGLTRAIRITIDKAALHALQRVYGFNRWHAYAPLSARPYRRTVAGVINALNPNCVVEVGCGLGVVLSLVRARHRYGYDTDGGAIRAARLIRSRSIVFREGDMRSVGQPKIDVLVLVNWIHEFSPQQLAEWLEPLLSRTRFLLLDAIDADNPLDYRYSHDFSFLANKARLISQSRAEGEGRRFMLYEVTR
jgi:hypothetical protein